MRWEDVLGNKSLIEKQVAWERCRIVKRMRDVAGFTFVEIGKRLNISTARARQLYEGMAGTAPVELYLQQTPLADLNSIKNKKDYQRIKQAIFD